MSVLSRFFGGQDPLLDRAQKLVPSVNILAIGSFVQFVDRYPALRQINPDKWDFTITVAGTCAGMMGLADALSSEAHYTRLSAIIRQELQKWNAGAEAALPSCLNHMQGRLVGGPPDDPEQATHALADSLGSWCVATMFGRPSARGDTELARGIGMLILISLRTWWSP